MDYCYGYIHDGFCIDETLEIFSVGVQGLAHRILVVVQFHVT